MPQEREEIGVGYLDATAECSVEALQDVVCSVAVVADTEPGNFVSVNFMPGHFDGPSFSCPSFSAPQFRPILPAFSGTQRAYSRKDGQAESM